LTSVAETPPIVTKKLLAKVYETLQGSGEERSQNTLGDELDPEHHLFFIDAFDMPSWHYSAERQTFEKFGNDNRLDRIRVTHVTPALLEPMKIPE
jgi:hypothetical protein